MRVLITTVFAMMASTVASQSVSSIVSQIPSCALTCLATGAAAAGCGVTDYACQCGAKRAAITSTATPCVLSGCTTDEAFKTLGVIEQLCKAVASTGGEATSSPAAAPVATTPTKTATTAPAGVAATTKADTTTPAGSSFASYIPTVTRATTSVYAQVTANRGSVMKAGVGMVGGAFLVAIAL